MAVLQNIRVKFGVVISVIIALALLSFIIDPSTLESALHQMSAKYDVGQIAGKKISYTDFQADVDRYTTINQILSGSTVQNEQVQTEIRNAAWQELLDKHMFIKYAEDAGISVGKQELLDLTSGENVSPLLAQNAAFLDENGEFSVDNLQAFLQQMDADESGQYRLYWNYLQNALYTQQYYQKYGALFQNSSFLNALQLDADLADNNTVVDADYYMAYYPIATDTTITVSSKEISDYYKSHKDFFKQDASRDIEYVVFEVVPSDDDINATSEAMEKAYEEFTTTDNMKAFLLKNSERSLSSYWYKDGELSTINYDLSQQIADGNNVTPIVRSGNSFYAARVLDTQMLSDSVYVKHILLQDANAKQLADSLVGVLNKGGNFSNLAAEFSADKGSAADGELGSIGWMTQTYMITGFEPVITAAVGKPFVLDTQYGTHVVLVSEKTKPVAKKQVAVLEKTALASQETFNKYYSEANNFAAITNGTYEGYKKALDETNVYSHSMNITEATSSYGAIDQAKQVTRWAFDAKKAGKASEIITVNNNYFFIAALKKINKEGYASVNDVAPSIQQRLYSLKAQDKTYEDVKAKIAGKSFEEMGEALGVEATHVDGTVLSASNVDPGLLGALSVAEVGKVTGPVNGAIATYIVKVNDKKTESYYTEDDAKSLAAQKAQYLAQAIMSVMSDNAGVVDNRERFY